MGSNTDLGEAPVIVTVQHQRLYVHPSVLVKSSSFFQAAVKKEWREGQQREIRLPEDDVIGFRTYAEWLYTGVLDEKTADTSDETYYGLAKLYVLGEKLKDATFQDYVINNIVASSRQPKKGVRNLPSALAISIIYRDTLPSSPARRLMVHLYAIYGSVNWMTVERALFYDTEFLIDLSIALLNFKSNAQDEREAKRDLELGAPCAYHHHDSDIRCRARSLQNFSHD